MSEVADVGGEECWKTPSVVQVFEVQTLDVSSVASLALKPTLCTVGMLISVCLFCWWYHSSGQDGCQPLITWERSLMEA